MKDDETKSFRLSSDKTISLKQEPDKTLPRAGFNDLKVGFKEGLENKESEETETPLRYRRQHILEKGGGGEIISAFDRKMNRSVAIGMAWPESGTSKRGGFSNRLNCPINTTKVKN